MPSIDRDCIDLLKDVPQYIIDDMKASKNPKTRMDELKAANKKAKELLDMRLVAHNKAEVLLSSHPNGPKAGLVGIITNDSWAKAQNSNVQYKQEALQGYVEKFISLTKQNLSTKVFGLKRDVDLGRAFVKAVIDGDATNPLASKMAQEVNTANDFMRTRFNKFGGEIGTLRTGKGYLPQTHDSIAIRNTPKEVWTKFTYDLLDDVGKMDVDRGALDLDMVYDTIATGGLNKVEGTGGGGRKSTVKKYTDERVLDFKDGDAWLDYQERFGAKDPMATMDDHIRRMTTDMALIETLGPNPDAMFKTLLASVEAKNVLAGEKKPAVGLDLLSDMYEVVSGKVDADVGRFTYAPALQTLRAVNTATMLNNAAISTITDPILASFTAGYRGMNPLTTLGGYFKNIVRTMGKRTFEEEQLMGLGADVFGSEVTRRFSELGGGWWAKASEAVMRATLMNILTESSRMSIKAQFFKKFLGKRKISDLTPDEHIRLLEKVMEEASYGVIMGDVRARAISTAGKPKGTITGEIRRSSTQFMTFPVSFMVKQGARMIRQNTGASIAGYGAMLFTLMTAGGALAMMGKDASKGYGVRKGFNPFNEDNSNEDIMKFWAAAALQGSGMGIVGDFIFSDVNRFGRSKAITAGGPTASVGGDLLKLTYGNIQELAQEKDTHFGSELVDFANKHANPVKTWYTQAAWNEYAIRNLKIMLDEDFEKNERRRERKRDKEYGQTKHEWLLDSREEVTEVVGAENIQESIFD
jgi:hypothetical protein